MRALDDFEVRLHQYFLHSATQPWALLAAIAVEFQQERIHAEHARYDERAAIAILNIGGV
jgi:hypothetical protein